MCDDCPICYEENPRCRLVCGHAFHRECIKKWYMEGGDTGCPMCRKTIYFKGLYKQKKKWDLERHEKRCSEVYQEFIQQLLEDARECSMLRKFFNCAFEELEEDYKKFKDVIDDPEDLIYLLSNPTHIDVSRGPPAYYDNIQRAKPPKKFKMKTRRF